MTKKTLWISIFLIAVIGLIIYFAVPKGVTIHKVSGTEARQILADDEDAVIIDVRTLNEFLEGHVPNAINIPYDEIATRIEKRFPDKKTKIIVYCHSGNRSGQAAATLKKLGYQNIYDLGAYENW